MNLEQFRICDNCDFSGVYAILNTNKNKIYIGSSRNIKGRLINHKTLLNHKKGKIKEMQDDYNLGDNFIAYVITPVRVRDEKYLRDNDLRYFEQEAIKKFNATDPEIGYNKRTKTGQNVLNECARIEWAQNAFDLFRNQKHYGYTQEKSAWNKERKEFIKKVLTS